MKMVTAVAGSLLIVQTFAFAFQRIHPFLIVKNASLRNTRQSFISWHVSQISAATTLAVSSMEISEATNDTVKVSTGSRGNERSSTHAHNYSYSGPWGITVSNILPAAESIADTQVREITSIDQLLTVMDGNGIDNRLTVVKYYADYCKLCQRASIHMKRLGKEFPSVEFTKVEYKVLTPPTSATLRALGVTKFPWVQIYRGGNCVASFSTGPSHLFMKRVSDTLSLCLSRAPDAWHEFLDEFHAPIEENAKARLRLLNDIATINEKNDDAY